MEQKFTNKSSYDTRFIWVSLDARTIHMSQYMTKDRRHKEASLADVTSVVAGPPTKVSLPTTFLELLYNNAYVCTV